MREILLYTPLYDYSAANFISQLEANKDSDITVRMNTNGGSPEATFGMIAKMSERTKKTFIKVDGKAHSMGAFMLAYATDSEALDVSEILIHRAAYPSYIESDPEYMTAEMWASLSRVNDKLRVALESKCNPVRFAEITGKTMDDVFNTSTRIDVLLTAEQAKNIGLINRVVSITPDKRAEVSRYYAIAAQSGNTIETLAALKEQPIKNTIMTLAEFKAQHSALYNEIITAERDRVTSFMTYADVDLEACKKGIAEGATITQTQMAEFTRKAMSAQFLAASEEGSETPVTPVKKEAGITAEKKTEADFFAEVDSLIGLKK
jgi:ATP-dependent protease ClpP protease subunit